MKIDHPPASMRPQEQGSVLVVALVLIVLLTIIGISASKTSEIELMIAGNERVYKQNFYVAEGSAMQGAQIMELTNLSLPNPLEWLMDEDNKNNFGTSLPAAAYSEIAEHLYESENWTDEFSDQLTTSGLPGEARVLALSKGVVPTSSWKMTSPKVYEFEIYGRSVLRNGEGLVSVGYRKAY